MEQYKVKLSTEAKRVYDNLSKNSKTSKIDWMLFDAINSKISILKSDIRYGNPISKSLIPKEYKIKYNLKNLFRIELPVFWRMLYTNTREDGEVQIIAFVIDITNHTDYNKKFGYRKK